MKVRGFVARSISGASVTLFFIGGAALLFLLTKLRLFELLTYHGDIFLHTQIARGPYEGRPIFFDNFYSPNSYIHNYFLLLLVGPVVKIVGTPALLTLHALLLGLTAHRVTGFLRENFPKTSPVLLPLLSSLALVFGPISFWLMDDPVYGWHSELLFFPLGLLFFIALCSKSWERFLWGLLLVLNREDGPVLACSLHLLASLLPALRAKQDGTTIALRTVGFSILKISLFWFGIFLLGMGTLYFGADPALARQSNASTNLLSILSQPEKLTTVLKIIGGALTLLLLPLLPCFCISRTFTPTLLALIPTIGITLIASATYLSKLDSALYHGLSWPPRFSMLYAIGVSGVLMGALLHPHGVSSRLARATLLSLFSAVLLQELLLNHFRDSSPLETMYRAWFNTSTFPAARLKPKEKRFLECLSKELPRTTSIAHTGGLGFYFYQHDFSPADNAKDAWRFPEIFLCDIPGRIPGDRRCRKALEELPSPEFTSGRVKHLSYAALTGSPAEVIVRSCKGSQSRM